MIGSSTEAKFSKLFSIKGKKGQDPSVVRMTKDKIVVHGVKQLRTTKLLVSPDLLYANIFSIKIK